MEQIPLSTTHCEMITKNVMRIFSLHIDVDGHVMEINIFPVLATPAIQYVVLVGHETL